MKNLGSNDADALPDFDKMPPIMWADRQKSLRILHVSGDFPDCMEHAKTPVIQSLLKLTDSQFEHRVVSLNRVFPTIGVITKREHWVRSEPFEWGQAWAYHAPPNGIAHATILSRLGDYLAENLQTAPPELLIGHKLTIEGIAVARAAAQLGVPYAITIQGNTDTRILAARPDLERTFARIFHEAAVVFAFAPWALTKVEKRLGTRKGPTHLLPCPTDLDEPLAPIEDGDALVTTFHLRHHKNKNLAAIAQALKQLKSTGYVVPFSLIGGGSEKAEKECRNTLASIPSAILEGALDRQQLQSRMNRAIGFVLPSHRETFGLVFVEALFAGLPIIYPANRAVSGYFEHAPFAIAVEPTDKAALAAAMTELMRNETEFKSALKDWQLSTHAQQFTRKLIAQKFANSLKLAMRNSNPI